MQERRKHSGGGFDQKGINLPLRQIRSLRQERGIIDFDGSDGVVGGGRGAEEETGGQAGKGTCFNVSSTLYYLAR